MSTMAWIAIAAMIVTSINSWLQFWLKERSEKNKALAEANPATNQPKLDSSDKSQRLTFWGIFRRHTMFVVALWTVGALVVQLAIPMFTGSMPTNLSTMLALIYALVAWVLVTILFLRAK